MKKVFGYPEFDDKGERILSTYDNEYSDMLMDVRVFNMKAGDKKAFAYKEEEAAVLLLRGEVIFHTSGTAVSAFRESVFTQGPFAVHFCTDTQVVIEAVADAQILVQRTKNDKKFDTKVYKPQDAPWSYSSAGKFGNVANRRVNTIFDIDIAPYSNMVLGEVLNDKGNWSGYLPHRHPQPELYYFMFDRPEGFGASFIGDEVYKSVDGSFSAIPGGELHPQAAAPGFQMYTCWMIRHLDGKPWHQSDRNEDERYMWLHDAK